MKKWVEYELEKYMKEAERRNMDRFTLGTGDLQKIGKGLLIAIIGAVLTYLSSIIGHYNFGAYTPVIVALWSTFANVVWKILDGTKA